MRLSRTVVLAVIFVLHFAMSHDTDSSSENEILENNEESKETVIPEASSDVLFSEATEALSENATVDTSNTTEITNQSKRLNSTRPKRFSCLRRQPAIEKDQEDFDSELKATKDGDFELEEQPGVQVVNGSFLMHSLLEQYNSNVTNRTTAAQCSLVFFYARWCPFSAKAAPNFNAMGRLFHDSLDLFAVDSSKYPSVNTQFGIMALPTILLFHNSKPVSKFNYTEFTLELYANFVYNMAGLEPSALLEVTETDYDGPIPTVAIPETDYNLYLAWVFTIVCFLGYLSKSSFCQWIVDSIRNNWREVEIQHEHFD